MARSDRHDELELNLLVHGSLTYLLGGRRATISAGQLAIFWAATPHQIIDFDGQEPYYVVTVPFPWFLQQRLPTAFVRQILQGQLVALPSRGLEDVQAMERWIDDLAGSDNELRGLALLEIRARLHRAALQAASASPWVEQSDTGLRHAEAMAMFVAQNYRRPLTVPEIAESAGLHPNYAMALFRRQFGTTLANYLTQHRVFHAQRLLVSTDTPVSQVALESGFGSVSRFNAAFRQICGVTPRAFRERHAA